MAKFLGMAVLLLLLSASFSHAKDKREALNFPWSVDQYYSSPTEKPVWTKDGSLNKSGKKLLKFIRRVDDEGLNPEHYHLKEIERFPDEILMTDAFFTLVHDFAGLRPLLDRDLYWTDSPPAANFLPYLEEVKKGEDPQKVLLGLLPREDRYQSLRKQLTHYRKLAENGGWKPIPEGSLKKGDKNKRVQLLRKRLFITGELNRGKNDFLFDDTLEEAVKTFQHHHGLIADGVVGNETREILNVPIESRIRQIEVNLERLRWMSRNESSSYLLINIPDFRLTLFQNHKEKSSMKVVVGLKKDWQTPTLSSQITHLVINPTWNVPPKIIKEELVEKIRQNPEYLGKERMKVYSLDGNPAIPVDPSTLDWKKIDPARVRIIQEEGDQNALGKIKFIFPNPYQIYLHDTPQQKYFSLNVRTFSHGCIRLQKPMELAEFILPDHSDWTMDRLTQAIESGKNQWLRLNNSVPIHIVYWTAWVDSKGELQFREDVYQKDLELAQKMGLVD